MRSPNAAPHTVLFLAAVIIYQYLALAVGSGRPPPWCERSLRSPGTAHLCEGCAANVATPGVRGRRAPCGVAGRRACLARRCFGGATFANLRAKALASLRSWRGTPGAVAVAARTRMAQLGMATASSAEPALGRAHSRNSWRESTASTVQLLEHTTPATPRSWTTASHWTSSCGAAALTCSRRTSPVGWMRRCRCRSPPAAAGPPSASGSTQHALGTPNHAAGAPAPVVRAAAGARCGVRVPASRPAACVPDVFVPGSMLHRHAMIWRGATRKHISAESPPQSPQHLLASLLSR